MSEINDVDERLLWLLRRAGDEWGAAGVAKVAARLAKPGPTLYVNHPRTEPVPGDVVRDEEADLALIVLRVAGQRFPDKWIDQYGTERTYEHLSPSRRLRLLVDGETGQAVQ